MCQCLRSSLCVGILATIGVIIINSSLLLPIVTCVEEVKFFADFWTCDSGGSMSKHGCSQQAASAQGRVQCLVECTSDTACIGVSVFGNQQCLIHKDCPAAEPCKDMEYSQRYFSKHCAHGGKWDPAEGRCRCVKGWVGVTCQELPVKCKDLIVSGHQEGHVRSYLDVQEYALGLVQVICDILPAKNYSNIRILYHNGSVDFNMSWNEYREGFYIDGSSLWAGLDVWSALSQLGYVDLFITLAFNNIGLVYRKYYGVHVSNASQGFRLVLRSSYENGRGEIIAKEWASFDDCLGPYVNIPFSTFDKDQDGNPTGNCASEVGSGWWFVGCDTACNLFGWGPSHWSGRSQSQWMKIPGVDHKYMTVAEMPHIGLYLKDPY